MLNCLRREVRAQVIQRSRALIAVASGQVRDSESNGR
jgi:hypothetical protein